jgi:hypothetical protein
VVAFLDEAQRLSLGFDALDLQRAARTLTDRIARDPTSGDLRARFAGFIDGYFNDNCNTGSNQAGWARLGRVDPRAFEVHLEMATRTPFEAVSGGAASAIALPLGGGAIDVGILGHLARVARER